MKTPHEAALLAEELRARLGKDNLSPIDPFNMANRMAKLTTVLYPLGPQVSGMCLKHERFSLIAVNSTQTLGRQRFTLAHELYHLHYDDAMGTVICPTGSPANDSERTADAFASYFLLPYHALRSEIRSNEAAFAGDVPHDYLLQAVLAIEQRYGMSRLALLVRLEDEQAITPQQKEALSSGIKAGARKHGYSTALYERRYGAAAKKADGDYLNLVAQLVAQEAISQGKASELLRDAFRDDICLVPLEAGEIID